MEYEAAVRIGVRRAEAAARRLRKMTGLDCRRVCAARARVTGEGEVRWTPVGKAEFLDIGVFGQKHPSANALVLIVDEKGEAKASTWQFMSQEKALAVASRVRLPVSRHKASLLRRLLEERDLTETVRWSTLRTEA